MIADFSRVLSHAATGQGAMQRACFNGWDAALEDGKAIGVAGKDEKVHTSSPLRDSQWSDSEVSFFLFGSFFLRT